MSMYIDEQMRERMRQIEANRKQYTENSIDEARARFNALQEQFEAAERQPRLQMELRHQVEQARVVLDDAIKNSSHLAARKKAREVHAQREKERDQVQRQEQQRQEAAAKEEARPRYLAAGYTPEMFESNWQVIYAEIVQKRVAENEAALRRRSPARDAI